MVVDIPPYPSGTDSSENAKYKAVHAFSTPRIAVVSGVDDLNFEVSSTDAAKFFVDAPIIMHTADWAAESPEVRVTAVTQVSGDWIVTVNRSLGFTPDSTYFVDLVGFSDEGMPYRLI